MKKSFMKGVVLSALLCGVTHAQDYHPISDVNSSADPDGIGEGDLWPVANLIQGPGVGFETEEPQNASGGGADNLWVTLDDAGFPSDYIEDVEQPILQFDLGADRTLKEISVWGYAAGNSNGTSQFSLRFATEAEGTGDGIFGNVNYGESIAYNPTFNMFVDPSPQQYKLFTEEVTARYVEFTNIDNYFISPGTNAGPEPGQEIDQRLLDGLNTGGYLPGGDRVGLGEVAFMDLPASFQIGDKIPRSISGDDFGVLQVAAARSGEEFGPASDPEPGLLQGWFDGTVSSKAGLDTIAAGIPMVPQFRSDETWWSGSADVTDMQKYPVEVEDVTSGDAYTAVLVGELLVPDGADTVQFLDGVDDYTYFALDLDQSGVAGDTEEEVLINDNNWTDALSVGNGGAPIVEADLSSLAGQWVQMEFGMSEGGGGDAGVLYWDALDTEDVFPFEQGDGVDDFDAAILQIPNSHLRSSTRELVKADSSGSLVDAIGQADVLELNLQVGSNGNDQIALEEGVSVGDGTSTLDVAGITIRIDAQGNIDEGTEFQIFAADTVTGIDELTLVFDDASLWNTSKLSQGILSFGPSGCDPNTGGDLDGNGKVEFADFLVLSGNFGKDVASHVEGDIDCNGKVEFADFLALSGNFGKDIAASESVPEPSGLALLGLGTLFVGCFRRRR